MSRVYSYIDVAGIVLAGGASSRFGVYKCLRDIDLKPMLLRVVHALDHGVVVAKKGYRLGYVEDLLRRSGFKIVYDDTDSYNPIHGIRAGIEYVESERVFIAACDYPYLKMEVPRYLCSKEFDAVVPYDIDIHVLLGCYSSDALRMRVHSLGRPLDMLVLFSRVYLVGTEELKMIDPYLRSLINVNYPNYVSSYRYDVSTPSLALYSRYDVAAVVRRIRSMARALDPMEY